MYFLRYQLPIEAYIDSYIMYYDDKVATALAPLRFFAS